MTEQEASVPDVSGDVSDEQFEKYFAEGEKEDTSVNEVKEVKSEGKPSLEDNKSQVEEKKSPKEEKFVPYDALHEERMRRKERDQEVHQLRQSNEQLNQNFQRMLDRINQQNQPKPPSFEEDPLSALRYENNLIKQHLQQEHLSNQQRQQHEQQQDHIYQRQQQFIGRYQNDALEYAQSKAPDFKEAYAFLNNSYLKELTESGFTREEASRLLVENETAIVGKAYQIGINPAERMYNLAKLRGYQNDSNNSKKVEQKLNQLEKGVKESRSLNAPGGKSEGGPLTLEQLSHLSDDELDEFVRDPKKWDKLMNANR
jgi:hypothetical protein